MRVPSAPSVSVQNPQTPRVEAQRVVPMDNAAGEQLSRSGHALSRVGAQFAEVGNELEDRLDESRVREADAKLADADRETGNRYLTSIGRAALDGRADALKEIEENHRRLADTFTTPQQREMFARVSRARMARMRDAIDGHYAEQSKVDAIGTAAARLDASLRDAGAALTYPDAPSPQDRPGSTTTVGPPIAPGEGSQPRPAEAADPFVESSRLAMVAATDLARLKGFGPEQTQALLDRTQDALHSQAIRHLVDTGKPDEAAAYLSQAKLGAEAQAELRSYVQKGQVVAQTAQVVREFTKGGDFMSWMEGIDTLRQSGKVSPEVLENATRELVSINTHERAARAEAKVEALAQASQEATLGGGNISARTEAMLYRAGARAEFEVMRRRGEFRINDEVGRHYLHGLDAENTVRTWPTRAEMLVAIVPHMTEAGVKDMVSKHDQGLKGLPAVDETTVLTQGLIRATNLTNAELIDGKVDPELFDRWKSAVDQIARELLLTKPTSVSKESVRNEAMTLASQRGFYLKADRSSYALDIEYPTGEVPGTVYFDEGNDKPLAEARLTALMPGTNTTYRDGMQAALKLQAESIEYKDNDPDGVVTKPLGMVWINGKLVDYERVGISDVAREALRAHRLDVKEAQRVRSLDYGYLPGARPAGQRGMPYMLSAVKDSPGLPTEARKTEWLRGTYEREFERALGQTLSIQQAQEDARAALKSRHGFFLKLYGITDDEIDSAGMPVRKAPK